MRYGEYALEDIKLFHSTVPAGRRAYREHHHTECELALFQSGGGVYSVKGREYPFQAGDIFLFGSDEVHCITEISSDTPLDLINIHFEPKLLWDNRDRSALVLLKLFFDRSQNFTNRIDRSNSSTDWIREKILEIEKEFQAERPGYPLKLKLELFSILLCLLRDYDYVNEEDGARPNERILSQLTLAMNYMDSHLCDSLTLEEIARQATMSKAYFSTVFKKFNGISPWDYITIKRVENAIELLQAADLTKLEIAMRCGFNSSANFYKAFSRVTGKSPSDYIR